MSKMSLFSKNFLSYKHCLDSCELSFEQNLAKSVEPFSNDDLPYKGQLVFIYIDKWWFFIHEAVDFIYIDDR